jgi:glucokinase
MNSSKSAHRVQKERKTSKKTCALALDVGGTYLKSALITSRGSLIKKSFRKTLINSQGPANTIIRTFIQTLKSTLKIAENSKWQVSGIGIGMPGPFDYEKGISLMTHKFQSIYGLNLKNEIIRKLDLKQNFLIRFEVDASVFLRGEAWLGAARNCKRVLGITLGTGLGSAFLVNDEIVNKGPGIPTLGIWCIPYKKGIVEDKISRRGILTRYKELAGEKLSADLDVKQIAFQGFEHKDRISLRVFNEFGLTLGHVLKPIVTDFEAECLVLGGQISKSFSLFATPLRKQLQEVSSLKKISRARFIDLSPLYGAAKIVFKKGAN